MVHPLPSEARRPPSGLLAPDASSSAEPLDVIQVLDNVAATVPPVGRFPPNQFAFVCFAAVELAFVFGLLVLTRLRPGEILQIAAGTTAISVGGFFGRNAIIVIGRRLLTGDGNH